MPIIQTTKQLNPRDEFEHYPTPIELCRAAVSVVSDKSSFRRVLDPGAGTGVWGQAVREAMPHAEITGVELRDIERPEWYDRWLTGSPQGNYMLYRPSDPFDLIIGNPPYGDVWEQEQRRLKKLAKQKGEKYIKPPRPADQPLADAERFVRKAFNELAPNGYLVYLLRLAFLEGDDRGKKLWKQLPLSELHVLSLRPSFTGNGKTDATAYAVFVWNKNNVTDKDHRWQGNFLQW